MPDPIILDLYMRKFQAKVVKQHPGAGRSKTNQGMLKEC